MLREPCTTAGSQPRDNFHSQYHDHNQGVDSMFVLLDSTPTNLYLLCFRRCFDVFFRVLQESAALRSFLQSQRKQNFFVCGTNISAWCMVRKMHHHYLSNLKVSVLPLRYRSRKCGVDEWLTGTKGSWNSYCGLHKMILDLSISI